MDESKLRELANALLGELPEVVNNDDDRRRTATEIDAALALPEGQAKDALMAVLRSLPETRAWVAERTDAGEADVDRFVQALPGAPTAPLGVHVVCPNGDYDRYLETATEDPGRCPYDGLKLVRADD